MFNHSFDQHSTPKVRRLTCGLGFAYATLGLRAGEARVDAIREATVASAQHVIDFTGQLDEKVVTLADVATSAYRLLDPRKRMRRAERIQLSILSERAMEMQKLARRPLLDLRQCQSAT